MKNDDFKLLKGFALRLTDEQTNGRTDICDCRVAFATENSINFNMLGVFWNPQDEQISKLSLDVHLEQYLKFTLVKVMVATTVYIKSLILLHTHSL